MGLIETMDEEADRRWPVEPYADRMGLVSVIYTDLETLAHVCLEDSYENLGGASADEAMTRVIQRRFSHDRAADMDVSLTVVDRMPDRVN